MATGDSMIDPSLARQIVEDATDYAIFTLDLRGRITSWSPGAERILGYSAPEAEGMDFARLFLDVDRAAGVPRAELEKAQTDGRAENTRWHVRRNGERFWANGVCMVQRNAPGLLKVLRDETAAKLAEDQRVLLLNELNHRLRNTLVTVQSIIENTLRSNGVPTDVRHVLTERIITLSQAHSVLVEQNWAGAELREIVRRALAAHEQTGRIPFRIDGPPVRLSPAQAVAVALALHELATNALKYGALSTLSGEVEVAWNLSYDEGGARRLILVWRESGGPPVEKPTRQGFGTRLIARSFEHEGGRATLDYAPDGLRCVIELQLSAAVETPMLAVSGDPSRA
jgi:PAS domain S-box-containing protein